MSSTINPLKTFLVQPTNRTSPKSETTDEITEIQNNDIQRDGKMTNSLAQTMGEGHPNGKVEDFIASHNAQKNLKLEVQIYKSRLKKFEPLSHAIHEKEEGSCTAQENKREDGIEGSEKIEEHAPESNGTASRAEQTPDPSERPEEREFRQDEELECRKCGHKFDVTILPENKCPQGKSECPEFQSH